MYIPRFYLASPLALDQTVILTQQAAHHIQHVLRLKMEDSISIFNGEREFSGNIVGLTKRDVSVCLTQEIFRETGAAVQLHLAQGIARGDRMDFAIQKAVELGVNEITPLHTARSAKHARAAHWQGVIISACEQSHRIELPTLHEPAPLSEWVKTQTGPTLILDPAGSAALPAWDTPPAAINILVGPESGFTLEEVNACETAGAHRWCLGPRVLRTETAGIAALSVLQYVISDK